MKKSIAFIFAAVLTAGAWAYEATVNGVKWYYNLISDGKGGYNAEITYRGSTYDTYSNEYSGSLTIPSTLGRYSVTTIGDCAFEDCSSLTSITIPNSVTTIGDWAFDGCSSLTSVTIPNGVTTIGSRAFSECSSLTSITIPNGVTTIGSRAFYYCSSLTSVTIPNSVTSIGYQAFYGTPFYNNQPDGLVILVKGCLYSYKGTCPSSVTIPDSVTTIGSDAFYNCSSLTSITIPDSVTTIGDRAFEYCSSLKSVTIPDSMMTIGECAFYECRSLTSVTIPDSVTTIGECAFYNCSSLTSVTIPNSVTSIGDGAFGGCSSLKEIIGWRPGCPNNVERIVISDRVTTIGSNAFYNCSKLTSITIPDSVRTIGSYAFDWCSSLTSITIPERVTTIGECAFRGCSSLTSMTIGNGVTTIESSAFYNCSKLTSITIPDRVTTIGECAFRGCSSLTSMTIGNGVTSIGDETFYGCRSLTSVTIPNSVTSIGDETFYGCRSLTSVTIPNSVTTIWDRAFFGCSSLTSVELPGRFQLSKAFPSAYDKIESVVVSDGETTIGSEAFRGCSSLTSVTIPDSVTLIESSAFSNCSSLKSFIVGEHNSIYRSINGLICSKNGKKIIFGVNGDVTIPDDVTEIGSSAFDGCSLLTLVTIPNSVTSIGDGAFGGCSSLTSVTIPNSVTSIGGGAFGGCSSLKEINVANDNSSYCSKDGILYSKNMAKLVACPGAKTSVTIPDSVTTIGECAFYNCSSLTSVTIPNSVTSIGDGAFGGCSSLKEIIGWRPGCPNKVERIVISDRVTSIGSNAFYNCSKLTSVTIPDSVTTIGSYAFRDCSSLTSVTIPNSVTTIGSNAFYNCSKLTSITIPDSVRTIGLWAFDYCSSLKTVYVDSEDANRVKELMRGKGVSVDALTFVEPPKATITPISGTTFEASQSISITCDSESATIYYTTDGSEPTMKSTQYTKRFRINGKTTIKARAFFDDGRSSNVVTAEYALGQCPDPVVSTTGGETFYHKGNQVSIAYDCAEGVVRYTTDGSEPIKDSPIYTEPFATDESMVVKAKAFSDNYFDSEVVTATLTREWEPVATPVISAAESFTGSKTKVELTCATEGAIIHYTIDGCEPNSHSKRYSGPFEVRETTTVKAYAILADYMDSEVATKVVTKNWAIGDSLGLPDHKFTTEGAAGWVDDGGAMKSGTISDEQTSILKSTFVGKGTLAFELKLACEEDEPPEYIEYDHYELWIDGACVYKMDGVHDWELYLYDLGEGSHEIEWRYVKDEQDDSSTPDTDGVWLRNIVWTSGGEQPTRPESIEGASEQTKAAFDQWILTYKVKNPSEANVNAFILGLAPTATDEEIKRTVEKELENLDLSKLAEGELSAAVEAIQAKYPNAKVALEEVTTIETNAHLYKLVIDLK